VACNAPVNEKNIVAILFSAEQAHQAVKNYRSEKRLLETNRESLKNINVKESALLMNVALKFRPEKEHSSYIRGGEEKEVRKRKKP